MMLLAGEVYTVKVQSGDFLNMTSETKIKNRAALLLDGIATVYSVERPGGLQYHYVRLSPVETLVEEIKIVNSLRQAFNQLGYENAAIVKIERGEIQGDSIGTEAVGEIAESTAPLAKPVGDFLITLVKWLALGIAAGIVIYLIIRRAKA